MGNNQRPPKKWYNNKPEEIFLQAECFNVASDYVNKASVKHSLDGSPNFGIQISFAANVNHAFACELYMKCLQVIEQGFYYGGHELKVLFSQLSQTNQNKIIKRHDGDVWHNPVFTMLTRQKPKTLLELLDEANDAFVDIRYSFETNKYTPYDLSWAADFIREVILDLRPDFKEFIQK